MANLNKILLMGHLTRDPELRYTPSGVPVADCGLATNRKYRSGDDQVKEDVCFVDLTFWGKQAETVAKFLKKGRPLFVEGRLKLDSWEGKDGGKRSKLSVVVERFEFLGTSKGDGARLKSEDDIPF